MYVDESGFCAKSYCPYGWGPRGKEVYGDRPQNTRPRTNLLAAKNGKKLIAPCLIQGSVDSEVFNAWFKKHLIPSLPARAVIIMDNASFHKKNVLAEMVKSTGHRLLFLPPYSPDFNPIEQDFAIIKKIRQYSSPDIPLDKIIAEYGN